MKINWGREIITVPASVATVHHESSLVEKVVQCLPIRIITMLGAQGGIALEANLL